MPSVSSRTEVMCESIMHGLDVMQHTIDSLGELIAYGIVHGVLLKGSKMMLKLWCHPLAIASAVAYKTYKILDAIFLQHREKQNMYPDPKKHCNYMSLNYIDKLMLWFKQADAMDNVLGDAKNKS